MINPIEIESEDFFITDKERSLMTLVFYGLHINPDPIYRIVTTGVVNKLAWYTKLSLQAHIKLTLVSIFTATNYKKVL